MIEQEMEASPPVAIPSFKINISYGDISWARSGTQMAMTWTTA